LDVVVAVLHESACVDLPAVAAALDQPDLVVADPCALEVLAHLFKRLAAAAPASAAAPAAPFALCSAVLARAWANPAAQLSLLEVAVSADREVWSFATGTSGPLPNVAPLDAPACSSGPANACWLNPNLVQLLLALGDGPCGPRAKRLLDRAARACPETLVLVLGSACADACASTQSRAANALLRDLLPLYFTPGAGGAAAAAAAARSLPLVQRLWERHPKLVLRCCRAAYDAAPTAPTVAHVIGLMRSVPNGGPALMEMPQRELVLGVVCVLADRGELDLESWVSEHLPQPAVAEAVLAFVARHAGAAVPRAAQAATGQLATLESLTAILKALDRKSSNVPEEAQRIEQVIGAALRAQPQLAPLLAPAPAPPAPLPPQQASPPAPEPDADPSGGDPGRAAAGGTAPAGGAPGQGSSGASGDEIEEMANSYFQKIYTSEQSIAEVIEMLKRFKGSSNQREQEIFACMIHNLFDEYRFFHKYPEKELRITGILFGTLIQHQLVSSR
jgi:CCR4-NOT transcription complex subunit 1